MVLPPLGLGSGCHDEFSESLKITQKLMTEPKPTLSFEYFPSKTDSGMEILKLRLQSMRDMKPAWVDVTFGAGGSTTERTLDICRKAVEECGLDVMIHLTCTNMGVDDIDGILERIQKAGIRNILALRGDAPKNSGEWVQCKGGFRNAVDLVRHIRSKYGAYFCIGVAGYPEGHSDCDSLESDLVYLKEKVDAGADLIVTQLFYDVSMFDAFVQKLKTLGVTVPVIPGIMPIISHAGLLRMTSMCKVHVPKEILDQVEQIKEDESKVKQYGVELALSMCRQLIEGGVVGIHIYTMNQEDNVRQIIRGLNGLLPEKHTELIRNSTAS